MASATPSKCTIWRVVTGADADAVDAAVSGWLAARKGHDVQVTPVPVEFRDDETPPRAVLAVDGKRVRGAIDAEGNAPHLLAAANHDGGPRIARRSAATTPANMEDAVPTQPASKPVTSHQRPNQRDTGRAEQGP